MTNEDYLHMTELAVYAIEQGFQVEYIGDGTLTVRLPVWLESVPQK